MVQSVDEIASAYVKVWTSCISWLFLLIRFEKKKENGAGPNHVIRADQWPPDKSCELRGLVRPENKTVDGFYLISHMFQGRKTSKLSVGRHLLDAG